MVVLNLLFHETLNLSVLIKPKCSQLFMKVQNVNFYRASSALAVYAMALCLSVRVSVRHKSVFY